MQIIIDRSTYIFKNGKHFTVKQEPAKMSFIRLYLESVVIFTSGKPKPNLEHA